MSVFLEPRVVEKPFRKRWLLATLELVARSPVRFGLAVALLGWIDASAQGWLEGIKVPSLWAGGLGALLLPPIWAFVAALSRGADDRSQTWRALGGFGRLRFWAGILAACAVMVALWLMMHILSYSDPYFDGAYINSPGALLGLCGAQTGLLYMMFEPCFLPLLVIEPTLSAIEARQLSLRASEVNGRSLIGSLWLMMLAIWLALHQLPSFGMIDAMYLVLTGVLNYVACRDIFERRSANLPRSSPQQAAPVTQPADGVPRLARWPGAAQGCRCAEPAAPCGRLAGGVTPALRLQTSR